MECTEARCPCASKKPDPASRPPDLHTHSSAAPPLRSPSAAPPESSPLPTRAPKENPQENRLPRPHGRSLIRSRITGASAQLGQKEAISKNRSYCCQNTVAPGSILKTGLGTNCGQLAHCPSTTTERAPQLSVELLMK